jgi:orotate phosphoribosyltransferase
MPREVRSEIQKVVSPAMGGMIIGHEMGRALGVDAMFVERPDRCIRTAPRLQL